MPVYNFIYTRICYIYCSMCSSLSAVCTRWKKVLVVVKWFRTHTNTDPQEESERETHFHIHLQTHRHTHTDTLTIASSSSIAGASIGNWTKAFDNPNNHTLSERKRIYSAEHSCESNESLPAALHRPRSRWLRLLERRKWVPHPLCSRCGTRLKQVGLSKS